MKLATVAVCLLIVSAGCVVEDRGTETATPSTPDNLENDAERPTEPTTPSSAEYNVDVTVLENLVHKKMNKRRAKHGVEPLNRSVKLDAIARYKSWDMAQRDYYSHRGPEGVSHSDLRRRYHSDCRDIGQNLHKTSYKGEDDRIQLKLQNPGDIATTVVNSLMDSTGHRKNILNPDYELQGIGVFVDENGSVFLTQEFCG